MTTKTKKKIVKKTTNKKIVKKTWKDKVIEVCKPIFDKYPTLTALPVYMWGRYYKYESAGEPINKFADEGFSNFAYDLDYELNDELLEAIDNDDELWDEKKFNLGNKLWNVGDRVKRKELVNEYNWDSRGGMCLILVKNKGKFKFEAAECDSPE